MARMNEADICRQCKQRGYFRTPELNEQLYLHFSSYGKIENLSAFTACRILWLEHNSIDEIENLEAMLALRVLHLEHNALRGLGSCILPLLETLHISDNFVSDLSGLRCFPNLQRLHAAHNDIDDTQLVHLALVPNLVTLDLSKNKIRNPEKLLEALLGLPKLASLQLSGNDAVRSVKNYRRRLICALPKLCHLDDMPVFENERRAVEAWGRGGREAEKAEYALIRAEEDARREEQRAFFNSFVSDAKARGSTAGLETAYARTNRIAAEEQAAADQAERDAAAAAQAAAEKALRDNANKAPKPATWRSENGANAHVPSRVAEVEDSDDDDIAVPAAAAAAAPKPPGAMAFKAQPKRSMLHADPFANLGPSDAAEEGEEEEGGAAEPEPSVPASTEEEVLAMMKLDAAAAEGFAAIAIRASSSPAVAPQDADAVDAAAAAIDEDADEEDADVRAASNADVDGDTAPPDTDDVDASTADVGAPSASDDDSDATDSGGGSDMTSAMATPRPAPVE